MWDACPIQVQMKVDLSKLMKIIMFIYDYNRLSFKKDDRTCVGMGKLTLIEEERFVENGRVILQIAIFIFLSPTDPPSSLEDCI